MRDTDFTVRKKFLTYKSFVEAYTHTFIAALNSPIQNKKIENSKSIHYIFFGNLKKKGP